MSLYPSSPGLWRLDVAAKMAGMSIMMFARGCESGDIPVSLVRIGPRFRFVKAAEFTAFLAARPAQAASEPDLFQ